MERPTTRRGFLDWLIALFSVVTAAALALPSLMYLWPAARGGAGDAVEVEGAAEMGVGQAVKLQVGGKVVIVVRHRSGFKAFSAICTHLGCLVRWENNSFLCPCHAAVFDAQGKVVSGPPPSDLPEYKVKEVDEKVFVSAA